MTADQRLEMIFRAVFELPQSRDVRTVQQVAEPKWDSLAHAKLVAAIESEFGVDIDISDALELTSFDAARLLVEERSA